MIDTEGTFVKFGYDGSGLKPHSNKPVVRVCDGCGKVSVVYFSQRDMKCKSCAGVGRQFSAATRAKLSAANSGEKHPNYGKSMSPEMREMLRVANTGIKRTFDERMRTSATKQGVDITDWEGFATDVNYCYKFDEACRESNRARYDRACFICGKTEANNGQKLCVHHVDMDKTQGCNNHAWKLIPVCRGCHNHLHTKTWQMRIEYILRQNNEVTEAVI